MPYFRENEFETWMTRDHINEFVMAVKQAYELIAAAHEDDESVSLSELVLNSQTFQQAGQFVDTVTTEMCDTYIWLNAHLDDN